MLFPLLFVIMLIERVVMLFVGFCLAVVGSVCHKSCLSCSEVFVWTCIFSLLLLLIMFFNVLLPISVKNYK